MKSGTNYRKQYEKEKKQQRGQSERAVWDHKRGDSGISRVKTRDEKRAIQNQNVYNTVTRTLARQQLTLESSENAKDTCTRLVSAGGKRNKGRLSVPVDELGSW